MDFHGTKEKDIIGEGHICDPNKKWGQRSSRGYLRSLTPNGQDMHNGSLYPHTLMYFQGTWTKGYWGIGTHDPNSKVIKGPSQVIYPKWSRYAQLATVSTYVDGFSWDLDKTILG